ncbi:hypothetical protein AB0A95_12315 [Micromonospora sp. NPDC049230]|uniref:hypothetical protein n=1 Tax=Micromonospora sp. NPDC049230 TaxID=3155502 RepID=UPI0033EBA573
MRTLTTLSRLRDVVSLTAGDQRIQTVFTHDTGRRSMLAAGVEEALVELGAPLLPWSEAVGVRFDLAVAASENDGLADLDAPVLLLPHGAGHQKFYPDTSIVSGLSPDRLMVDGRVVPAAIALPHAAHLRRLAQECRPAASRGVVVGDPALSRMRGSQFRSRYLRVGFGGRDKRLVVVASTFGPDAAFARLPELPARLVADLPADEYQVVVLLHPGVWAAHGPWQVRAWLAQAAAYGLQVVPPHEGWQAALLASSVVITDHGSLGVYAAALDKPVMLVGRGSTVTVPGSAAAKLAAIAPSWDVARPPQAQVDEVIDRHVPGAYASVTELLAQPDADGEGSAQRLRRLLYGLLRLDEPPEPAMFAPVLAPTATRRPMPAVVVGAVIETDGVRIERYPDLGHGSPREGLTHRHLVADIRTASLPQLAAATVLVDDYRVAGSLRRWADQAAAELARWPQAHALAAPLDDTSCTVWADGRSALLRADEPLDPVALASLAYVRLTVDGRIPPRDRIYLGPRVIEVQAAAA